MKNIFIPLTLVFFSMIVFGQINKTTIKCRIWNRTSFCTPPDSVNVPSKACQIESNPIEVYCGDLDKKENLVCIWLTFEVINNFLPISSKFENVTLISKNSKKQLHPYAYLNNIISLKESRKYYEKHPIHNKLTAADLVLFKDIKSVYFSNESTWDTYDIMLFPNIKYDLFFIFEEGNVGDKFIISNFIETEIK